MISAALKNDSGFVSLITNSGIVYADGGGVTDELEFTIEAHQLDEVQKAVGADKSQLLRWRQQDRASVPLHGFHHHLCRTNRDVRTSNSPPNAMTLHGRRLESVPPRSRSQVERSLARDILGPRRSSCSSSQGGARPGEAARSARLGSKVSRAI